MNEAQCHVNVDFRVNAYELAGVTKYLILRNNSSGKVCYFCIKWSPLDKKIHSYMVQLKMRTIDDLHHDQIQNKENKKN